MSIGRNREEQELTKLLASTLVAKEVLEPMQKIGWGHGSPPAPDYGTTPKVEGAAPAPAATTTPAATQAGQPAPAAPAAKVEPAAAATPSAPEAIDITAVMESLRDANGMILGKYKTVPEAIKGAGHVVTMAKQAFTERAAALAEAERLRAENLTLRTSPAASPAAVPVPTRTVQAPSRAAVDAAQGKLDAVLSSIKEDGGVLDADSVERLSKTQRDMAEAMAKYAVDEALSGRDAATEQERASWLAVDEFMKSNHPESLQFADEIGLHLASDPLLSQAVGALVAQGKKNEASALAWKSLKQAMDAGVFATTKAAAEAKEVDLAAKEQARQEAVAKARIDAGVVTGSAGGQGIHLGGEAAGTSREEIEAARSQMRLEGDAPGSPAAVRFRHLIIGQHLDPSIFGGRQ